MPEGPTTLSASESAPFLRALARSRARLLVYAGGAPLARGVVSDVEPGGEMVVELDLQPRPSPVLASQRRVEVECVVDGVPFFVGAGVVRLSDPARTLRLARPDSVQRLQRREFYRVNAEQGSELVLVEGGRHRLLPIFDLSGGGVGTLVEPERCADLSAGTRFELVEVRLPGEDVLAAVAIVRYLGMPSRDGARVRCGLELLPSTPIARERLFRAVARREREMLGRRQHHRAGVAPGSLVVLQRGTARARVRRILDVSAGGVLVEADPTSDADLVVGAQIEVVELRLLGDEPVHGAGVVRRVVRTGAEVACGVELVRLTAADRERLQRYARHSAVSKGAPRR